MKQLNLALLFAFALAAQLVAAEKPMNIVVLYADDWRHDTLGAAGHPVVKTPALDRLASQGIRFTQNCVTTAICGVSRASLYTGQWMSRHGNRGFKMFDTPWEVTFPAVLREHGYYVGNVGKWHCGDFPADQFDFGTSPASTTPRGPSPTSSRPSPIWPESNRISYHPAAHLIGEPNRNNRISYNQGKSKKGSKSKKGRAER